jgi:uncharacterized membrane protein
MALKTEAPLTRAAERTTKGLRVQKTETVLRPADELYRFWRDFTRLPLFMDHVKAVSVDGDRSHWVVKAPLGRSVEWDAEIVADVPGAKIAWRSLDGADVDNEGEVEFRPAPGDRGTEVRVVLRYAPPGGRAAAKLAELVGEEPGPQLDEDLHRFKQLMETGRIVTTDGQSHGRR